MRFSVVAGAVALLTLPAMAARPVAKLAIDSTSIQMGYTVDMHLTVNDANATEMSSIIILPDSASGPGEITHGVEVVEGYETPKLEVIKQADGASVLKSIIKLQSFDSGDYIIPAIMYTNGHDTVLSNTVALRVFPVDSVTIASDLLPMATVLPPYERKLIDYLPDWLVDNWVIIVIGLLIIIAGGVTYLLVTKRVTIKIMPQKRPEPPYYVAIAKLNELRNEQLCESGRQKEYYTRLTDILREYLDKRFNINAMEMTSTQIRHALNSSRDEIMSKQLVAQVLEIADYVKFAKAQPLSDDNRLAFESALQFVEDTKPAENPEEINGGDEIKN